MVHVVDCPRRMLGLGDGGPPTRAAVRADALRCDVEECKLLISPAAAVKSCIIVLRLWRQSQCLVFGPQDPPRAGNCIPGAEGTLEVVRRIAGKLRDERLAIARDRKARRRLMAAERLLSRSVIPAKADIVRAAFTELLSHYPQHGVTPDLMPAVMRDWIDDLGRFPPAIVRVACQAWRRGENAHAPAPGQIIALCANST